MDISKIASYYIYYTENIIAGNDIYCTLEFKNAYDMGGLYYHYENFIRKNSILQYKFVIKQNAKAYWEMVNEGELELLLEIEKERLSHCHKIEDVYHDYLPTNNALPIRIYPINEKQIIFSVNHVYTNGYGVLYWLDEWLKYSCNEKTEENIILLTQQSVVKLNFLQHIFRMFSSIFNAISYLKRFHNNAGKDFFLRTISCLNHDYSINHQFGYEFKIYNFDEKETAIIISNAKLHQQTISGYFSGVLCKVLFQKYPDKDRICITYPFDIRKEIGISNGAIGNYTSNLTLQIFRNNNIDKQIHDNYELKNKSIPYGIAKLISLITFNEEKIRDSVTNNCQKRFEERSVDQLTPFAFSNLGRIDHPFIKSMINKISFHCKSQSILITCCALNNNLSIGVSVSKDLYLINEVTDIIDEIMAKAKRL